jgi:hypothetical protein
MTASHSLKLPNLVRCHHQLRIYLLKLIGPTGICQPEQDTGWRILLSDDLRRSDGEPSIKGGWVHRS